MLLQRREIENGDGFAHVPDATIRRELPNARWRDALHLIDATDYSKVHGRARGFRVKPEVEQAFLEAAETISMADYIEADKVNLFSGRLANRRLQSRYHDNSRNSEPRIIVEAMKVLSANQVPFVPEAIEGHLQRLKQESDEVGKVHGRDSDEYRAAYGRYLSDKYSYLSVLNQHPEVNGSVGAFHPAYIVRSTGRIHHIGGGLQSASRLMKAAAYTGIDDLRNYDLENSQSRLVIQYLEEAGLDPSPLEGYLEAGRDAYAGKIGISPDLLKGLFLAMLMGATVPKRFDRLTVRPGTFVRRTMLEYDNDERRVRQALEGFREVFDSVIIQLSRWHKYLVEEWIAQHQETRGRSGATVSNAVGKKFSVAELRALEDFRAIPRLSAFLLQGHEALFIHTLTTLGTMHGFTPVGNEHDGLIVLGEIPSEAIDAASRLSGLRNAKLVEKPFIAEAPGFTSVAA